MFEEEIHGASALHGEEEDAMGVELDKQSTSDSGVDSIEENQDIHKM